MDAWLEVLEVHGPVLVQDGGRAGRMHHGVPPGGALVPEWLAAGNRAVGNAWGSAALECYGRLVLRLHGRSAWVSVDGQVFQVEDGGLIPVPAPKSASVRYVAVEGGLAVPEVLGGRGTLLVARLGGHEGRALKRGDVLPLGAGGGARVEVRAELSLASEVRVVLGPDVARFGSGVEEVLLGNTFTVSPASDRVGMRLRGPMLPQTDTGSGAVRAHGARCHSGAVLGRAHRARAGPSHHRGLPGGRGGHPGGLGASGGSPARNAREVPGGRRGRGA